MFGSISGTKGAVNVRNIPALNLPNVLLSMLPSIYWLKPIVSKVSSLIVLLSRESVSVVNV